MNINLTAELSFKTARSGGSGGQNVNKVETMVEAYWHVASSQLITTEQKEMVVLKLNNRINKEGMLLVKSQIHRSQLANKEEVIKKINSLVKKTIEKKIPRIATKPSKAAKEKRIIAKKKEGEKKALRGKINDY